MRTALSARLASLSVHSAGEEFLLRLKYVRNVKSLPGVGDSRVLFALSCLRKRKQIGRSSLDGGVVAFCDARCVIVVKGWSCRTEEPEW